MNATDNSEIKNLNLEVATKLDWLQAIYHSTGEAVITINKEGYVTSFNDLATQITGLTMDETYYVPYESLFPCLCESGAINQILTQKKTYHETLRSFQGKNGQTITLFEKIRPVKNSFRVVEGAVVTFTRQRSTIQSCTAIDPLTNLPLKEAFLKDIEKQLKQVTNLQFVVALIDINGLASPKNTEAKHLSEEKILALANFFKQARTNQDILYRWDSSSFLLVSTGKNLADMNLWANTLQTQLLKNDIKQVIAVKTSEMGLTLETMGSVSQQIENYLNEARIAKKKMIQLAFSDFFITTLDSEEMTNSADCLFYFCEKIAHTLSLSSRELVNLEVLAKVYNIGKIGITPELLNKDEEQLTPEELYQIKHHSVIGYQLTKQSTAFSDIAEYLLTVNERWDGKGYPLGLKEKNIPLISRIVSVVAYYVSLKKQNKLSEEMILAKLLQYKHTRFDPNIINCFVSVLRNEQQA